MPGLVQYQPSRLPTRTERVKARELSRIRTATDIAAAQRCAQVDLVESVTESALLATAHLGALESHLIGRVPHAEGRLRHVADGGAVAMANVVAKLAKS